MKTKRSSSNVAVERTEFAITSVVLVLYYLTRDI